MSFELRVRTYRRCPRALFIGVLFVAIGLYGLVQFISNAGATTLRLTASQTSGDPFVDNALVGYEVGQWVDVDCAVHTSTTGQSQACFTPNPEEAQGITDRPISVFAGFSTGSAGPIDFILGVFAQDRANSSRNLRGRVLTNEITGSDDPFKITDIFTYLEYFDYTPATGQCAPVLSVPDGHEMVGAVCFASVNGYPSVVWLISVGDYHLYVDGQTEGVGNGQLSYENGQEADGSIELGDRELPATA